MKLAELRALDVPALWAGLTPEQQTEIGAAALAQQSAQLVSEDDGSDTTAADRVDAIGMASDAYSEVASATERAFPQIQWWTE